MTKTKVIQPLRLRDVSVERYPFQTLSPNASPGKRWKFRRNAVIYLAYRGGFSQRVLADVFDLPRSRIATIVKEFQALALAREDNTA
jgi:hypothetical protein